MKSALGILLMVVCVLAYADNHSAPVDHCQLDFQRMLVGQWQRAGKLTRPDGDVVPWNLEFSITESKTKPNVFVWNGKNLVTGEKTGDLDLVVGKKGMFTIDFGDGPQSAVVETCKRRANGSIFFVAMTRSPNGQLESEMRAVAAADLVLWIFSGRSLTSNEQFVPYGAWWDTRQK